MRRSEVNARWRELVLISEDLFIVEIIQEYFNGDSIALVGHTTTIVALPSEVSQRIKWCLVWILIKEDCKLSDRDTQIGFVECVCDVPSKRSVESPLLNDSMEEAEAEHKLAELLWIICSVEEFRVADWIDKE